MAKITTFDVDLIRTYMEGSEALRKGIAYCKSIQPDASDAVAKESAIRLAQDACRRKWINDSTGYIDSEYKAFLEFSKDVEKGFYFSRPVPSYSSVGGRDWFLLFICLFLGPLGVHRFISGYTFTGFIWLCTGGLFLIGWIRDIIAIWNDDF